MKITHEDRIRALLRNHPEVVSAPTPEFFDDLKRILEATYDQALEDYDVAPEDTPGDPTAGTPYWFDAIEPR